MSGGPENPYRAGSALPLRPLVAGGNVLAWFGVLLALAPLGVLLLKAPGSSPMLNSVRREFLGLAGVLVEWPMMLAIPAALMAAARLFWPRGRRQAWMLFGLGLTLGLALSLVTALLFHAPAIRVAGLI